MRARASGQRGKAPASRIGWHNYYAKRFNKTKSPQAAQMALWYQLLHLAFDAPEPVPVKLDPHAWLDKYIIEQAAAYGMTPEAKAFLFDSAAHYDEIMEVNNLTD